MKAYPEDHIAACRRGVDADLRAYYRKEIGRNASEGTGAVSGGAHPGFS